MNARTQGFILLLFGGALLRLASGDVLLRYVRPSSRPWGLLAGAGIVGLAIWCLVCAAREGGEAVDAHGHGSSSRAGWLVLAPTVAILVITPQALGSFSAAREPVSVAKPSDVHFPALGAGNPVADGMLDFAARALWDDGHTLTGRRISLTGFVLRSDGGGFVLSRLVITCCAADARPIDIGVDSAGAVPAADTWVRVVGTYAGVSASDSTLPILRAATVTVISAPSDPYDG